MASSGENAMLCAQLMDAQKDATRWLSIANSAEERAYLRKMQLSLADLQQILDRAEIRHRIESRGRASGEPPSLSSQPEWKENVTAFLKAFQGAKDVTRLRHYGHLDRLASRLGKQDEPSKAAKGARGHTGDRRAMVEAYIEEVRRKYGKSCRHGMPGSTDISQSSF